MSRIKTLCLLIFSSALSAFVAPALAEATFPSKPIRMVVPFPPGGSTDVMARLISKSLSEKLGGPIVIENKPGAGTVVGADLVAKSTADGYTLLFSGASTYTVNPILFKRLPYDYKTAFEAIGLVGSTPLILLANPKEIKANTLHDLASELRGKDTYAYGSFGNGSTTHFAGEMLNDALGTSILHVPYKGSAPAITDLIGGQIALTVDTVVGAAPHVEAGRVKAIAVTSSERSQMLPQVPTAVESGYPAVQFSTWFAIVAPAGLPDDTRAKLVTAVESAMKDKALQDSLVANGFEPEYGTPGQYQERVARESERLQDIATKSRISIN